ncbi:IgA FC receptor [Trichinella pseudospiralis]|uniref:IgA FC receptor n=2 Tax=Trichinella pseudospiralis TaxID=6337 RepID=A0A0V1JP53_TRIPS|nr:IgA FC receptor [Trichinella pseudospiralis]
MAVMNSPTGSVLAICLTVASKPMSNIRSASSKIKNRQKLKFHKLNKATGRRHQDVTPSPEFVKLIVYADAAVSNGTPKASIGQQAPAHAEHLQRQLSCWNHHRRLGCYFPRYYTIALFKKRDDRQQKGSRFARACLCTDHQISALQKDRNAVTLHKGRNRHLQSTSLKPNSWNEFLGSGQLTPLVSTSTSICFSKLTPFEMYNALKSLSSNNFGTYVTGGFRISVPSHSPPFIPLRPNELLPLYLFAPALSYPESSLTLPKPPPPLPRPASPKPPPLPRPASPKPPPLPRPAFPKPPPLPRPASPKPRPLPRPASPKPPPLPRPASPKPPPLPRPASPKPPPLPRPKPPTLPPLPRPPLPNDSPLSKACSQYSNEPLRLSEAN